MNSACEPVGTLEIAIQHTAKLLDVNAALAIEQAGEILKAVPNHPVATLLLGVAQRRCDKLAAAIVTLQALGRLHPKWTLPQYELGLTLGATDDGSEADISWAATEQLLINGGTTRVVTLGNG